MAYTNYISDSKCEIDSMEILELGNRVLVSGNRSGVVRYIGEPDFSQGKWVGIELDKPTGKNNGEINGHSYFVCPPNHGLFVKFSQVLFAYSWRVERIAFV